MKITILSLIVVLLLAACAPIPAAPTITTEPQAVAPTATAVPPAATQPPAPPTPTPVQADDAIACNPDAVVATVRRLMPYDEFEVGYSNYVDLGIKPTIDIWYVDPKLDPAAAGDQIGENAALALRNAATLGQQLARSEAGSCIAELFTKGINTVVVDRAYNGWLAGLIAPAVVAAVDDLAAADDETIASFFESQYMRANPTEPLADPPADACSWPEVRNRIAGRFPADQPNTLAYPVRDEDGATLYATWLVPEGFGYVTTLKTSLAAIGDILAEQGCLHPPADTLITAGVDATGNLKFLGRMQGDALRAQDITQLEILYPEGAASEPTPVPPPASEPAPATQLPPITGEGALHLGWVWPEERPALLRQLAAGSDGTIYVADQEGLLRAVTAPGEELWSLDFIAECGEALPPVLSAGGDVLYFVGVPESEEAPPNVCATTLGGELLWTVPAEGLTQAIPTLAPDGSLHLRTEISVIRITPDGKATAHTLPQNVVVSAIGTDTPPAVDGAGNSYFIKAINSKVMVVSPDYEMRAECTVGRGPAGAMKALGDSEKGEPPKIVNMWVSDVAARADAGFVVAADPGDIIALDPDCNELWRYKVFASDEPTDRLVVAAGPDGAIYAGGPGGLLLALTADGELMWRNEAVEGAAQIFYLAAGNDEALAGFADGPSTLLGYAAGGKPTLTQRLYTLDDTGAPVPLPGGDVAQVQQAQLKVYTADPALQVETKVASPPADEAAAEAEIVQFMLDLIVEEDIESTLQYIEESGWEGGEGPTENLIVWNRALSSEPGNDDEAAMPGVPAMDEKDPVKVWSYNKGGLKEIEGDTAAKLAAIEAYDEEYMNIGEGPDIFAWGFYEFAITSLDESLQKAQVYRAASCGGLCGSGYLLTLERTPDGEWVMTNAEHLWQS
jgi:hypothetical protein